MKLLDFGVVGFYLIFKIDILVLKILSYCLELDN